MKPNRALFHSTQLFGSQLRYGVPVFAVLIAGVTANAGDILRGGRAAATAGTPGAPTTAGTPTPAATDAARANARDSLTRTTQTLAAMRAMQAAARSAAISGPNQLAATLPAVPNGLVTGGLKPAVSAQWTGADAPVETVEGEQTTVTIKQTSQQALLHWETFNVGKATTLTFDQKSGGENSAQWIVFNKVTDPTAHPTQILGSIKADGQVYVINGNGIIFGGSSQVNSRSLTVSSLPLNTNLIERGLLNNPDAQFLFSGLAIPAGLNGTPSFTPEKPLAPDGKYGDVVVQPGAVLESPSDAAKVGGRVTLVGPNVVNQGSILTPDGQAILAAGLQVGFAGHASADPSLRGLDVFVGAVTDPVAGLYAGRVAQDGVVEAARGSITIAGRDLHQNGVLFSSTSVALNGRIDMQANYNAISNRATATASGELFLFKDTGAVTLAPASAMGILPEYDSDETTIGTVLALRSQANLSGKTVRLGAGSILAAPNAQVSLTAGTWFFNSASATPTSTLVQSGGQVYLEEGARVDVAGSIAVPVPVSQNILSVDLRAAELADSPLQRQGALRNATVQVDIRVKGDGWIGTPLADVSGFANLIQRAVGQLTVAGGTVSISAGESVVMQAGSGIDVSGGSTRFEGGEVQTSRLLTGGRLVDIGSASPDVLYDGVFDGSFTATNDRFGVTDIFHSGRPLSGQRYEAGYTEGAAGGRLAITAPAMALDGSLVGVTVTGERQRQLPPAYAALTLAIQAQDTRYQTLPLHSPTPPVVTFSTDWNQTPAAPFATDASGNPVPLSSERLAQVYLSPDLMAKAGFGALSITNHDGTISVPEEISIHAAAGSAISFQASNITLNGGIFAPGGKVTFECPNLPLATINLLENSAGAGTTLPTPIAGRGVFALGSTGRVSAQGLLVDDRLAAATANQLPLLLGGGSISINAFSAELAAGGLLDVSGGARVDSQGAVSYGKGGSLLVAAGRDLIEKWPILGGHLTLGATLAGFSGTTAGSLRLQAPAFQIGGASSNPAVNVLSGEFFSQGGFGSFSIIGGGLASATPGQFVTGLYIAPQTTIRPVVAGWLADTAGGRLALRPIPREEGVRTPASLAFGALGAIDSFSSAILGRGDVLLAAGAAILTDAKGAVSFNGETVTLAGSVISPGGTLTVAGATNFPSLNPNTLLPTTLIGNSAFLSTAGKQVLIANPHGLRQGQVVPGGTITVSGNIVAERGATLDVSGASGILDLSPNQQSLAAAAIHSTSGKIYVPVTVDSNGGRITLSGSRMLYSDATLSGHAGGSSAIGGSVAVSSGRFIAAGTPSTTAESNLLVRQSGFLVPPNFVAQGVGTPLVDLSGTPLPGIGNFTVSTFAAGGFDSLALNGNVGFEGDVSLVTTGALRVASGGVIAGLGKVNLAAAYLNLGQAFTAPRLASETVILFTQTNSAGTTSPYSFAPIHGVGELTVAADLIDIGNLSLNGVGTLALNAAQGDVRGNGTLQLAGSLTVTAGQLYPPTQCQFAVFAYDHMAAGSVVPGSITIRQGALRPVPWSAGGTLALHATEITQSGTLRVPLGQIRLGWDGSGAAPINPLAGTAIASPITALLTLAAGGTTAVSTVDPLTGSSTVIPYGISLDGKSWIDPAGNDITVGGPPGKSVNLAALNLVTQAGSTVDVSGGGDLYAYRWIAGNGGSEDILASSGSFAVVPGYGFNYSPYAPFNSSSAATNLGGATGYTNSSLKVGDQVTLAASKDLAAGTYTLLPARYALLPGALLVTPKSTVPAAAVTTPDGAALVSGYRANNLDPSRSGPTLIGAFEVAPAAVFRARAEYQDLLANTVLREAASSRGFTVPRLPVDAGYLALSSSVTMSLRGGVSSLVPTGGRGSVIDINSSSDILITPTGIGGGARLVLSALTLNSFGAESLLIGGLRSFSTDGVTVTANSTDVMLDNAGTPLTGKDIILVSREKLTLGEHSGIVSAEEEIALDALLLGNPATAGSGNGVLVRVSANASGRIARSAITASGLPELTVRPGTLLTAGNIVLDSTAGTRLADSARLLADEVSLNSGQISLSLANPGTLNPTTGLILGGEALASLQNSASRLALLSYSTIDVYGTGTVGSRDVASLSLQSSAIRGFNTAGGAVTFRAANLSLGNRAASPAPAALVGPLTGSVTFDADHLALGAHATRLNGYAATVFAANGDVLTESQGAFEAAGTLDLLTPVLSGASASKYEIRAAGALRLARPAVDTPPPAVGGLAADLTLQGASVQINGDLTLPSGRLTLRATTGDLTLGDTALTRLNLAGTTPPFVDTIRYTGGGTVNLLADLGSVRLAALASTDVSAPLGGGNAGAILVKAPGGVFDLSGTIIGTAGSHGTQGEFTLDAGSITGGSLAGLDATLNAGGFTQSRDYRIRTGNVNLDGPANSHLYRVAADSDSITVATTINASGTTGGVIDLKANGSLTVANGTLLNAAGTRFDAAGKGGSVTLEAGAQRHGFINPSAVLDLQTGAAINLAVAAADATSASRGEFSGTLHLRAPRHAANSDLQVNAIGSTITGASSIVVEGAKLYALTGTGTITKTLQATINDQAAAYLGTANYPAMLGRLTSLQPALDLILAPGAEIYNLNGNLTLGSASSTATDDWNLAALRFGPRQAPGILTLRASENLTFFNALSDGFSGGTSLWLAPLMAHNPLLPANSQSWSLRLSAGADLSAASFRAVKPLASLSTTSGLVQLGKDAGAAAVRPAPPPDGGTTSLTSSLITNLFQVIRTGSGNIDINAGRSLQLLNPFASIYTAGTRLSNPTKVNAANDFVIPITNRNVDQGSLGVAQQPYFAQYSMAGGNVTLTAAENLERRTRNNSGLIDDSSRQLPNNWLYRRGYVASDGDFGKIRIGSGFGATSDPAASTTWWVDFSNFFQDVGALGGGNVTLTAGHDIVNVGAVIPTNARAARGTPTAASFIELGGGDLQVTSGNDISGGVYYVERGRGTLEAGGSITTNGTRSPSFGLIGDLNNPVAAQLDPLTWMPTTLFVGKSSFDLTAAGDLILGPVSNPFLLPQGIGNKFWYKTYFSTISADSEVTASSLGGNVTYRNAITLPSDTQSQPMLQVWHQTQLLLTGSSSSTAWFQPWLRLAETSLDPFSPVWPLSAANLSLTALSGDLNLVGDLTTFPSPVGQLELLAAGSVNALQPAGLSKLASGESVKNWVASTINLSDANPSSVPQHLKPLTSVTQSPNGAILSNATVTGFMNSLSDLFIESGSITSTNSVLQTRQARHTPGGLHRADTQPLRLYSLTGDLSGLTLYSGKPARISAALDISDVALYLQNNAASEMTMVTAGRDIIAYNSATPLRVASLAAGNTLTSDQTNLAGDIQIAGPGTLQVLAGRNLDLGTGFNNPDGTGTGITSIGNLRNPYLTAAGASLVVGAGIGPASSLASSSLAFDTFITDFVTTPAGQEYLAQIAPGVDFATLPAEEQAMLALEVFFLTLRDTGRDFNDPASPGYRQYDHGFAAIKSLFPTSVSWEGEILTQGRDLRTRSGGSISVFAPGGGLAMANSTIGNPLTPPGIVTESGGGIAIFTDQSVNIGIGRIFTLKGGNVAIWSSAGDIAAGSSSRTVSAAPPTRVIIDPQSAAVETDLAGLATGGGIGVLATVEGVAPGDVDLIAPAGTIDAGDAGIRVSGNINLAAVSVTNAGNISAGGTATGAPATTAAAPSISAVTSASNATAAAGSTAPKPGEAQKPQEPTVNSDTMPSLYTVEVIGYGGGDAAEEEPEEEPAAAPVPTSEDPSSPG